MSRHVLQVIDIRSTSHLNTLQALIRERDEMFVTVFYTKGMEDRDILHVLDGDQESDTLHVTNAPLTVRKLIDDAKRRRVQVNLIIGCPVEIEGMYPLASHPLCIIDDPILRAALEDANVVTVCIDKVTQ